MEQKEIVERIASYCKQGFLEGVRVYASWCDREYTMQNVRYNDGNPLFDQDRRMTENDVWEASMRDAYVSVQCQPWLEGILAEIEKIIQVDRNLF